MGEQDLTDRGAVALGGHDMVVGGDLDDLVGGHDLCGLDAGDIRVDIDGGAPEPGSSTLRPSVGTICHIPMVASMMATVKSMPAHAPEPVAVGDRSKMPGSAPLGSQVVPAPMRPHDGTRVIPRSPGVQGKPSPSLHTVLV